MNTTKDYIYRYMLFLVGLFIASMGVAFSTKAGLGTSPVASIPYSVSLVSNFLTFGGWLNLLSVIQITVQVILLRRRCNAVEIIIQTILAFIYGYLTNLSCWLIKGIEIYSYPMQIVFMLSGCIILAFGIWVQLKGNVAMLPGEAMNRAISTVTGKRYENIKIFFDILYIAVSAVICLLFLGKLEGVREGSIIAAVFVGNIIKFYNRVYEMFFSSKQIDRIMSEVNNRIIIDVRTKDEYASGHIPGAICIPNESISNIDPVQLSNKDQNIIVYCQTGMRASKAAKKLKRLGYKNVFNFGGINSWHGDIER